MFKVILCLCLTHAKWQPDKVFKMSDSSFDVLRRIASVMGVAGPESDDNIYDVSFLRSIERAINRSFGEGVVIEQCEDQGEVEAYVTSAGETLMGVALRHLGTQSRWPEIVAMNEKACRAVSPNTYLPDGMRLKLPLKLAK